MPQIGGSHSASSGSGQSSKRGPKRPQPLAPFCKYPNAPGTLKAWEGGLVLLDGSAGMTEAAADWQQQLAVADSGGCPPAAGAAAAAVAGSAQLPAAAAVAIGGVAAAAGSSDVAALQEENARLKEQLQQAVQQAQQWGRLNAQLQQLTAERLLGDNGQ